MSKKKIPKGVIASIILFAISGFAFVSGYLKENIITDAEDLKIEIANDEVSLDRMNAKITEVILYDQQRIQAGNEHERTAYVLASTLEQNYATLTPLEINNTLFEICAELYFYEDYMRHNYQGRIAKRFYIDTNDTDFYLAEYEIDGIDLYFTLDEYTTFNAEKEMMEQMTATDFLNYKQIPLADNITNSGFLSIYLIDIWFTRFGQQEHWMEFYKSKALSLQANITANQVILADLESKASFYGYGVTIISVTTILASALASQLNDKEREIDFSHIKAEIYDDKSMIITKKINYAIPLLILALIFAILGLILPIILF